MSPVAEARQGRIEEMGLGWGMQMDDASGTDVMLIDNEDLVRRGFRQALGEASDITVVAEARVGPEALRLIQHHQPRVILVDANHSAQQDGSEFIRQLAPSSGEARRGIIVLTSLALDDYLFRALKAGASGFVLKSLSQEELIYAVRSVAGGAVGVAGG